MFIIYLPNWCDPPQGSLWKFPYFCLFPSSCLCLVPGLSFVTLADGVMIIGILLNVCLSQDLHYFSDSEHHSGGVGGLMPRQELRRLRNRTLSGLDTLRLGEQARERSHSLSLTQGPRTPCTPTLASEKDAITNFVDFNPAGEITDCHLWQLADSKLIFPFLVRFRQVQNRPIQRGWRYETQWKPPHPPPLWPRPQDSREVQEVPGPLLRGGGGPRA